MIFYTGDIDDIGDRGDNRNVGTRGTHLCPLSADYILHFGITRSITPYESMETGVHEHRKLLIVSYISYGSYDSYFTYLYTFPMSPIRR